MLVMDKMTNLEIFNELVNDAPHVTGIVEHAFMKYRREILKRTKFPVVFKAMDYVSPKKNHWFVIFRAFSRKDADAPVINYACTADSKDGFYAFMVSQFNEETAILLFPPHLFKRYRERFLNGSMTLKGVELIKYFFSRNPTFQSDETMDDKKIINTSCEDGVLLGEEKEKNFIVQGTYLTYEMLRGRQIEAHESLYDLLHENDA